MRCVSAVARGRMALPAAMILAGIVSVQFGAGLADKLFGQIPPLFGSAGL